MRFLCLHGIGTSSQIFEMQTAAIRRELGPDHTFEFVEGTLPHPPGAGIDAFTSTTDDFYAYFKEDSGTTIRAALADLQTYLDNEGPFDAVMAFSQGAGLASMFIIRQSLLVRQGFAVTPPFKCGIFFSGEPPADPGMLFERGNIRLLDFPTDGIKISIPTAHIWGSNDKIYPNFGPVLAELCSSNDRNVVVHDGGHELPGTKSKIAVIKAVQAIRRTIASTQ